MCVKWVLTFQPFSGCKLYHNKVLKELWLGYNDLDCTDAQHIADMLRFNHSIELIDISNNNIRDEGAMYLVQALILQAIELERRSGLPLQRARAIEDDELVSPMETTAPVPLDSHIEQSEAKTIIASTAPNSVEIMETVVEQLPPTPAISATSLLATEELSNCEPAVAVLVDVDVENDADDDNTEDTVRTLRGSGSQGATGQSMLDKLLSMNSDSSSEEAPSNISTDTLAACCSEDISEISNDIYDVADKLSSTATLTTSMDESTAMPLTANCMSPVALVSPSLEQITPPTQQQQQQSSQTERNLCGNICILLKVSSRHIFYIPHNNTNRMKLTFFQLILQVTLGLFLFKFLGFETLSSLTVPRLYKLVNISIAFKIVALSSFYVCNVCGKSLCMKHI